MANTNNSDSAVLSLYLKEINKVPLLSREEEDRVARKAVKGDKKACDLLVKSHLRFVVSVAKRYQNQGLPLDDLISEGNVGLLNAIKKYDPGKGNHFISYAVWWIKQAILKAIYEKSRMVRLPLNRTNELIQIERTSKELEVLNGEEPTEEEIADILSMSIEDVKKVRTMSQGMASLDAPNRSSGTTLGDLLEDKKYKAPDVSIMDNSLLEDINYVLHTLPKREAKILEYRYGLNNKKALSLKEVGELFNLTKERIRQIEKKAISRIQASAEREQLRVYVA